MPQQKNNDLRAENLESVFLKILKRILLVTIGSGLLGNALYIYGQGYYQGYIEGLGFEYTLFPLSWNDSILWTYSASRELGASSIAMMVDLNPAAILIVLLAVYLISRIWMQIPESFSSKGKSGPQRKFNYKIAKRIALFKKDHIWIFRFIYIPARWFLIKEQSFIAFAASYFFMIFLLFIPLLIVIWIYFPLFGVNHGSSVAEKRLEFYEEHLCGGPADYWSQCIKIDAPTLEQEVEATSPVGRVLFKNGNLIAVLTENGPVTLSMPKEYYFQTLKNPCYGDTCETQN